LPSISRQIHELCSRHHGRTALVELAWDTAAHRYRRARSIRYGELLDGTLRLIDALGSLGAGRGDRIAVLLDNSIEMVMSEWACLLSGLVWVALNVRSSAAEHAGILADCSPSVVLVAAGYRERIQSAALPAGCRIVEIGAGGQWQGLLEAAHPRVPRREPDPEDPVRIRYTSGTAGKPKGAVLPRRCYDASLEVVSELIGPLTAGDVVAQVAPMTHAAGAMLLPHALAGATALLADRFDAAAFLALVVEERVTAAFLVPTMLLRFIEAASDGPRPDSLRSIVYGGAAMPVDRLERGLELLGPVFVQIYGLTESNWPVTALGREEHLAQGSGGERRRRLASCGRPTAIGQVRIVAEGGREAAAGESGELLVRGRNTMTGYWANRRADVKGLDADGWMHTGDVAVRDQQGFVTIVDRLHDMIVSGGFNVYPREVEEALSSHPAVLESAVVGRADPQWGERIHAVVVLRPGGAASEAELAEHVAARTAAYKKPRSFEFTSELPKNAAGKVLRRALKLKTTTPPA